MVGAAGSAVAGSEAAGATRDASNAAITEQQNALSQEASLSAPYRGVGTAAIPQYEALLGIGPQGSAGIMAALQNTPGYQFALSQGETGIKNAASAQGGITGATLASLDEFNTGLASQTYQQNVADIGGAVGMGQAAAAGQAQNVAGGANNISSLIAQQGQTTAGIDANIIAGITGAGTNAVNQYTTLQALNALNNQTPAGSYGGGFGPGGSDVVYGGP